MKELKKQIDNRTFEKVYLLFGDEKFLVNKYEDELVASVMNGNDDSMNKDIFIGKTFGAVQVIDAVATLPFMSEYRCVIVKDSGFFTSGRTDTKEMESCFNELDSNVVLIFVESDVDKRSRMYKEVVKNGRAVEFSTPKEDELVSWVRSMFEQNGKTINNKTINYLLKTITVSMTNIEIEVSKLCDYVKDEEVTNADIDNICTKSLDVKIFGLVQAFGEKKPIIALDIYNNMILMKESPLMILAMISRQLKILLECKILLGEGKGVNEIAKELGMPTFVIKDCVAQSKNFSKGSLYKGLELCLNKDVEIKTGLINDKIGVEVIILNFVV